MEACEGAHLMVGSNSFKGGDRWLGSVASLGHGFSGMFSSALCYTELSLTGVLSSQEI